MLEQDRDLSSLKKILNLAYGKGESQKESYVPINQFNKSS